MGVDTAQKLGCRHYFFFICSAGAAEYQQIGIGNLVIEKLTEVSHVHFAFSGIHDRDFRAYFNSVNGSHRFCHIRQLSDTGRLNQDTVGSIFRHNLLQRFAEVSHECAADAA